MVTTLCHFPAGRGLWLVEFPEREREREREGGGGGGDQRQILEGQSLWSWITSCFMKPTWHSSEVQWALWAVKSMPISHTGNNLLEHSSIRAFNSLMASVHSSKIHWLTERGWAPRARSIGGSEGLVPGNLGVDCSRQLSISTPNRIAQGSCSQGEEDPPT